MAGSPVLREYGTPPETLQAQLGQLKRAGFEFLSGDEFSSFLRGTLSLPARAVLVTFDDCYDDLGSKANPVLSGLGIPAIAFAISSRIGRTNEWDTRLQAPALPLLDAEALRSLEGRFEIGAHSRTHPDLNELDANRLDDEIAGSVQELEGIGLRRPRYFCYPYGQHGPAAHEAVKRAGLAAAFTVEAGVVVPGADHFRLPRIEILRSDGHGPRFWLKIASAGAPYESFSDRVGFVRDLAFAALVQVLRKSRSDSQKVS
jgi:peptidoglycan/xylan/chitin deacetylase (PgdA/CDA1 family)